MDFWHTCSNEAAPYLKYYVAGKDESLCRGSWHLVVYPKRGRQEVPGMAVSPDRTRLEDLREVFREDGYVIVRGLLGEEELEELRRAIETPLIQQQRRDNRRDDYDGLAIIHDIIYLHPTFLTLARHEGLLDIIEALVGPDIEIQHCKINWKPPEKGGGEVHWHQDFAYLPHTNHDLCAAFFVLEPTTLQNRCMRVIPGSHKLGQLEHVDENGKRFDPADHRPVDLVMQPGDCSIHHVLTLHSSYPNQSDHPRCAVIYEYRAADAMQMAGVFAKTAGVLVRGRPSRTVCCDAGVVMIPPK